MALQVARRRSFGAPSPVYGICLVEDGSDASQLAARLHGDDLTAFATAQAEGERRFRLRFWNRGGELPFHSGAALAAVAELSERGWMDRFGGSLETSLGSIQARHDRGRVAWLQLTMLRRSGRAVPDPRVLAEILRCDLSDVPPVQRWSLGSQEVALVATRSLEDLESMQPGEQARQLARELGVDRWVLHCDRARDRLADVTMRSFEASSMARLEPGDLEVDGWGAAALAGAWHQEGKGRAQLTVAQPHLGARVLAVFVDTHVSIGGVTS